MASCKGETLKMTFVEDNLVETVNTKLLWTFFLNLFIQMNRPNEVIIRLFSNLLLMCFKTHYTVKKIAGLFQLKFGSNIDKPKCWVKN